MARKSRDELLIPFNKAHIAGKELYYIAQAVANGELKGDGPFTKKCSEWIEERFGIKRALITHSCTGALEMAAILAELKEGDEVIMPSFTFTSTANAFLLRGAKPRFIDIREDTCNMNEKLLDEVKNDAVRAICPVHYAGVGCEMTSIMKFAKWHDLRVIEDAAHAILAKYKGRYLGTFGDIGTFSFHETKNYSSGEGGALLLNEEEYAQRAEIVREKGTNRSMFFRGEIDKYSWVDVGSSYLPSEIITAFLYGQLENADEINNERLAIWDSYYARLQELETLGICRLPIVPDECEHNAHMFYLLLPAEKERNDLMDFLKSKGVLAVFHYVPLHLAPMGEKLGYKRGELPVTESVASRILRLPLYCGLSKELIDVVCDLIFEHFGVTSSAAPAAANY